MKLQSSIKNLFYQIAKSKKKGLKSFKESLNINAYNLQGFLAANMDPQL